MRSFISWTAIICGTIIVCGANPLWSAPAWILAALGVIARR
jgi:hypothetical protein